MKTLKDIFKKLKDLDYDISKILKDSTYEQYDDFSELEIDYKDSEQLFMLDELRIIMNRMEEVHNRVRYLSAPVEEVGTLRLNRNKRYETEKGHEYTCGSPIEVLINDKEQRNVPFWARTSIEASNGYYLVGYKHIPMDGLKVRVRREDRGWQQ